MTAIVLTEAQFQQQIIDLAHALGWRHNHTRRTIGRGKRWTTATSCVGWPDLTLFRPQVDGNGELFFVELKTETGVVTPEQQRVHELLRQSGQEVHVWRPSDLDAAVERLGRYRRGR